jgi:hypothetical protein
MMMIQIQMMNKDRIVIKSNNKIYKIRHRTKIKILLLITHQMKKINLNRRTTLQMNQMKMNKMSFKVKKIKRDNRKYNRYNN